MSFSFSTRYLKSPIEHLIILDYYDEIISYTPYRPCKVNFSFIDCKKIGIRIGNVIIYILYFLIAIFSMYCVRNIISEKLTQSSRLSLGFWSSTFVYFTATVISSIYPENVIVTNYYKYVSWFFASFPFISYIFISIQNLDFLKLLKDKSAKMFNVMLYIGIVVWAFYQIFIFCLIPAVPTTTSKDFFQIVNILYTTLSLYLKSIFFFIYHSIYIKHFKISNFLDPKYVFALNVVLFLNAFFSFFDLATSINHMFSIPYEEMVEKLSPLNDIKVMCFSFFNGFFLNLISPLMLGIGIFIISIVQYKITSNQSNNDTNREEVVQFRLYENETFEF